MANGTYIRIKGAEEVIRRLDRVPENAMKMTVDALKFAAKPVAQSIRAGVPYQKMRRLVKVKVIKDYLGDTQARVGLYNVKAKNVGISDWFKAYWANYGTLKHRDSSHKFDRPIKRPTRRRRNNEGQRAQNFFESAIVGWQNKMFEAFQRWMVEHEAQLLD